MPQSVIPLIDPSQLLRPEPRFAKKPVAAFRDYTVDPEDALKERVRQTYHMMHTHQTVDFVNSKKEKWLGFTTFRATVREALEKLNALVDESDPDTEVPNIAHAFQTAERIRRDYPDAAYDWFHLTGLIHDLGKVLALYGEPQWAVVGDTFVVGCRWPDGIVYRDTSFVDNADARQERYQSECGVYERGCGLGRVQMSWGHDEYLYQVLRHNGARLPERALFAVRYHSFYPWHTAGEYRHLANERDEAMRPWLLEFNRYDLYTKCEELPDIEALWPYYQGLIDKYVPGVLEW